MKIFTLLLLSLALQISAHAAISPTVPSSNLTFTAVDGQAWTGNFTPGNGAIRLVVMKAGSPVTGVPVNGVDYTANSVFGTPGAAFTAPGEYVVGRTSFPNYSVTNLLPGTVYYVAIFDFNGTGVNTQYLQIPLTGSQSTAVAPLTQASAITNGAKTGNTMTISWTSGNGTGRLVVARKGAAVNADPTDLTNYGADPIFGSGSKIGTDNFVVYKGAGSSVQVKNLEPNTVYHFAVYEYNGATYSMFLRPAATYSALTNAGPNQAPTSPGFTYIEGNSFRFGVTQGNGTKRLFIAKKASPVTAVPVNGTVYTANAAFGTANTEIAPGEFVVGATTGNAVFITNLEPNTVYHFRVYEYDEASGGGTYYLTSSYLERTGSTATTPSQIVTNIQLVTVTGNSATIRYTNGNGSYRHVMMKAGSPVDAVPQDLIRYSANANFGSGSQVSPGNYTMFSGINGNQFSVTGLVPGVTYHLSIYEFNGTDNPVYSATGGVFSFTVPVQPTTAASNALRTSVEGNAYRVQWTNGNGTKRIVIARKGAAVTAVPTDGVVYTANESFGQGQEITPGQFVVLNLGRNYVDLKNLEINTTYHLAVFEYNESTSGVPDYLESPFLATTGSTHGAPTTNATITNVTSLQATSGVVHISSGNGTGRLVVIKKDGPVDITPQDLVQYTYSSNHGTAASHMGNGNYAIAATTSAGSVNMTSLQPNNTYHLAVFEYNGVGAPVYLTSNPSRYNVTTPDVAGATVPTVPASIGLVQNVDGNKLTLKWTNGNGERRLVVMRKDSPVSFVPAAATSYTANNSFGAGTDLGNGQFAVFSSNGNTVDISNLSPASTYHYTVFEYNGTGTLVRYLTSSVLASTATTSTAPVTQVSGVQVNTGTTSIGLSWTNGNGSGRIVVMKEAAAVTAVPATLGAYPANAVFGTGSQLAVGEFVVYSGTSNTVTVTGLVQGRTYHYAIFEYNGSTAPVYNTVNPVTGSAIASIPLPVTLLYFHAEAAGNNVELKWATASETNNAYFTIQRSTDGLQYVNVADVAGNVNSSSEIAYQFTDNNAPSGTVYYRLKQTDIDGRFTYSGVQRISRQDLNTSIKVYPNPVRDRFTINLPGGTITGTATIFDAKGNAVRKLSVTNGQYVQTEGLAKGVYYLRVETRSAIYSAGFVKE